MTRVVNPKDIEALKTDKAPLDLGEPAGEEAICRALAFGAGKYGIRNYIEAPISARVYVAAMRRHITAWLEGEDFATDSGVHHLGHVGANVHIALAAIEAGTFIDDRHGREPEASEPEEWADDVDLEPRVVPPCLIAEAIRNIEAPSVEDDPEVQDALDGHPAPLNRKAVVARATDLLEDAEDTYDIPFAGGRTHEERGAIVGAIALRIADLVEEACKR